MVMVQVLRLAVVTWLVHRQTGYWVLVRPFTQVAQEV